MKCAICERSKDDTSKTMQSREQNRSYVDRPRRGAYHLWSHLDRSASRYTGQIPSIGVPIWTRTKFLNEHSSLWMRWKSGPDWIRIWMRDEPKWIYLMQWLGREVTWEEKGVFRAKEMFLFLKLSVSTLRLLIPFCQLVQAFNSN